MELRQAVGDNANEFARSLAPVITEIRACGQTSLRDIAAELNDRGIETRRGGQWHVSNVRNLLQRLHATIKLVLDLLEEWLELCEVLAALPICDLFGSPLLGTWAHMLVSHPKDDFGTYGA